MERAETINRRAFLKEYFFPGIFISLGVGSGVIAYASEKKWEETLNEHPLGDKYKQETEAAQTLREEYSNPNSDYERRLQITREIQEKNQVIKEMYKDIAPSVQMPQSLFNYGKNKGTYAASIALISLGSLAALNTFSGSKNGENQPPQIPR